jgi:predicted oxidoreductase
MSTSSKPNTTRGSQSFPSQPSTQFANLDIGSPLLAGSALPVESGWDLIGGGADIWETADQFHFAYKDISGDFDIAVRVESFTPAHLYSKAGLMIRESLDAESAHLMFLVFADNEPRNNNLGAYEMQFRPAAGENCQAIYPAVRPPAMPEFPAAYPDSWLRVARRGNQFSAFASTDGKTWKRYAEQVLPLASVVKVGPALTSHNPQVLAKAAFRDYIEYHQASPQMVKRVKLAARGPEFSRMVLGTWRILDTRPTPQEINRRIHTGLDLGITTIDTAEIYGLYEVEKLLGEALALSPGLRDKLELVTKAGIYVPCSHHPERRTAHYNATGPRLIESLESSLRWLGTDHVELFLVHRPDWLTRADDTAAGLNGLLGAGKIRSVGVSNYSAAQFDLLNARMEQPLVTNQIEFHLLHPEPIHDGTLQQCERLGVLPMAWSPLAGGRIFDPGNPAAQRLASAAKSMSTRYHSATLEQLAYAWVLAHPSHPLAVIGTNKPERLQSAAKADTIVMEREDWYALWEAAQGRKIP